MVNNFLESNVLTLKKRKLKGVPIDFIKKNQRNLTIKQLNDIHNQVLSELKSKNILIKDANPKLVKKAISDFARGGF